MVIAPLLFLVVPFLPVHGENSCSAEESVSEATSQHVLLQARLQPTLQLSEETSTLQLKEKKSSLGCGCDCKPGYCLIWGDPHFTTFDGKMTKFAQKRVFWVVKSPTVQIQGRANQHAGRFIGFGATGPWLDNNKLIVNSGKVFWNDDEILKGKDDEFIIPGLVDLQRHRKKLSSTDHLKDLPDVGDLKGKLKHFQRDHYVFKLPNNVEMYWVPEDSHVMIIKMPAAPPQSGWCGNFNGDEDDEPQDNAVNSAEDLGPVPADEALWNSDELLVAEPTNKEPPAKTTWEGEPCAKGKEACEPVKSDLMLYNSCVFDVCTTDDADMANSSMAAEGMEIEEGRDIPERVGKGRCLDGKGKHYTAFEETEDNHEPDCQSELRDMASTEGVRGAQQAKGGRCQILVDPELVDMMSQTFSKVSDGEGTKLVDSVTEEEGWECWKLN